MICPPAHHTFPLCSLCSNNSGLLTVIGKYRSHTKDQEYKDYRLFSNRTRRHWNKDVKFWREIITNTAFFKKILFIFSWETQRETGKDRGRGRSRLLVESLMWDWILGPRDHALSRRQMLNHWATQASLLWYSMSLHLACWNYLYSFASPPFSEFLIEGTTSHSSLNVQNSTSYLECGRAQLMFTKLK